MILYVSCFHGVIDFHDVIGDVQMQPTCLIIFMQSYYVIEDTDICIDI